MRVLFEHLGDRQVRGILRSVDSDDPGALADLVGWWPELTNERKVELLETIDVEERVSLVLGWAKEAIAERELSEKIANDRSEEHTSELQSLMRISYAVFCLTKK